MYDLFKSILRNHNFNSEQYFSGAQTINGLIVKLIHVKNLLMLKPSYLILIQTSYSFEVCVFSVKLIGNALNFPPNGQLQICLTTNRMKYAFRYLCSYSLFFI